MKLYNSKTIIKEMVYIYFFLRIKYFFYIQYIKEFILFYFYIKNYNQ